MTDGLSWKINPAGLHRRTSKKPKRGVRSPPRPYRPPGRTCAFAHARPALRVVLCVLRVLCDFQNTLAVLRALARRPSLCLSVFSVVSVFFVICGSNCGVSGDAGDTGDAGAPLRGDGEGAVQGWRKPRKAKPPNFQTSKLPIVQSACGSTPLICSKSVLPKVFLAKRRNNLRFQLRRASLCLQRGIKKAPGWGLGMRWVATFSGWRGRGRLLRRGRRGCCRRARRRRGGRRAGLRRRGGRRAWRRCRARVPCR